MTGIVFALLLVLALFAPTIWLSVNAKPIGPVGVKKPYRWGTFAALLSAVSSLSFLGPVLIAAETGQIVLAAAYASPIILLVATCLFLLERKRLGVIMFFLTNTMLFAFTLSGTSLVGQTAMFNGRRAAAGILGYSLINSVYFAKRWTLFKTPSTPPVK